MPRLCEFYPGICLTTDGKGWKNLSQGDEAYVLHPEVDLGHDLDNRVICIHFPADICDFYLHIIHCSSETHQVSYKVVIGDKACGASS